MISEGVDVSKGKSTVCILKPYGEILMAPKDYAYNRKKACAEKIKTKVPKNTNRKISSKRNNQTQNINP